MAPNKKDDIPEPLNFNIDIKSFVTDMGVDLKVILAFTALVFLSIYTPFVNETVIRSALGLAMVLFIPGYTLIAALFPGKSDINGIERIALSFGLSIAIAPLIGLGLNFTPWGIRLDPIVISLSVFTLLCALIANKRRHDLSPEDRFNVDFGVMYKTARAEIFPQSETGIDRILTIVLIACIILSICVLAYVVIVPKQGEKFTEFYILGPSGKADNYPTWFTLGDEKPITVGVVNHEYRNVTYDLLIRLNNSNNFTMIHSESLEIADNQTWEKSILLKPDQKGTKMKLEFLLYADQTMTAPYREVHLWIDVN